MIKYYMYMKKRKKRSGFTLIELLVVVAIIGILALVVLSSLGKAKKRALDSAIKKNISHFRSTAEVYSVNNDYSYENLCDNGNPGGSDSIIAVGVSNTRGSFHCNSDRQHFRAYSPLVTENYACVNSTGQYKETTTEPPAGSFDC
jgi:prepilin-type N-terminal cleavage/methylation domain-containing protein